MGKWGRTKGEWGVGEAVAGLEGIGQREKWAKYLRLIKEP